MQLGQIKRLVKKRKEKQLQKREKHIHLPRLQPELVGRKTNTRKTEEEKEARGIRGQTLLGK